MIAYIHTWYVNIHISNQSSVRGARFAFLANYDARLATGFRIFRRTDSPRGNLKKKMFSIIPLRVEELTSISLSLCPFECPVANINVWSSMCRLCLFSNWTPGDRDTYPQNMSAVGCPRYIISKWSNDMIHPSLLAAIEAFV